MALDKFWCSDTDRAHNENCSVRDLRNRFARVHMWIAKAEPVQITKSGQGFCPPPACATQSNQTRQARHPGALEANLGGPCFLRQRKHALARNWMARGDDRLPGHLLSRAMTRRQDNSPGGAAHFRDMPEALHVTGLLLFEFRQSVRYQVWPSRPEGHPLADCERALADLQTDLGTGGGGGGLGRTVFDVHRLAEILSNATVLAAIAAWMFSTSPSGLAFWACASF